MTNATWSSFFVALEAFWKTVSFYIERFQRYGVLKMCSFLGHPAESLSCVFVAWRLFKSFQYLRLNAIGYYAERTLADRWIELWRRHSGLDCFEAIGLLCTWDMGTGTGTGTRDSSTGTCTGTWMTEYWLQLCYRPSLCSEHTDDDNNARSSGLKVNEKTCFATLIWCDIIRVRCTLATHRQPRWPSIETGAAIVSARHYDDESCLITVYTRIRARN